MMNLKKALIALALCGALSTTALAQPAVGTTGPGPVPPACTTFGTAAGTCIQGAGAGGTPSSITLTNGTGLPISTGVNGLGTGVATGLGVNTNATGGFPIQTGPTTWTPADNSGASLTFTGVSVNYTRIGNIVFAYGAFTYPATASGAAASISGLPVTVANAVYGFGGSGIVLTNSAVSTGSMVIETIQNTLTAKFLFSNGDVAVTNAQLSGVQVIFMLIYPAA